MLDRINLSLSLEQDAYREKKEALTLRLGELQRKLREKGIPVVILFDGWGASGKGTIINRLLAGLDPRGYNVYTLTEESPDEHHRPYLWRWWNKVPAKGRIAIFETAWYEAWNQKYLRPSIEHFERQLVDDGCLVIKIFLHISRKEQKRRFEALEARKETAWRVSGQDWHDNRHYDELWDNFEKRLEKSSWPGIPWRLISAEDGRHGTIEVFSAIEDACTEALEEALPSPSSSSTPVESSGEPQVRSRIRYPHALAQLEAFQAMEREVYEVQLADAQTRIRDLQFELYRRRKSVMVLYEGWDAAGKGGNIRRLCHSMDPRGYEVIPVAAPSAEERVHHYLWRFWKSLPKDGHIGIYDRTWYGRVLVERVEGFCRPEDWDRAYQEINEFEDDLVAHGSTLVKFWLHIDPEEQLRRFEERQNTPGKEWKITEEDWRNRKNWKSYEGAIDEMVARTSTPNAPWTLVPGNNKLYARVFTLRTIISAIERTL